jgi:hypothetical protein
MRQDLEVDVQRVLVGMGTILLGLLLLTLAVPRLVAHLLLLPGDAATKRALSGELLTPAGYQRILDSRKAALAWLELPEARIELGGTFYFMAQRADELHVDATALLREAREQLERGLAEAPADTAAWFTLADIRSFLSDPDKAEKALHLSMLAAPHDVTIAPLRAGMALALWARLEPSTRAMVETDVKTTLGYKAAGSFVRRMLDADLLLPLRQSVADDPVASASLWLLLRHDESAG